MRGHEHINTGGGLGEGREALRKKALESSVLARAAIDPEVLAFNTQRLDALRDPKTLFEGKRAFLRSFAAQIQSHLLAAKDANLDPRTHVGPVPPELESELLELRTELQSAAADPGYRLTNARHRFHALREGPAAQANQHLENALICALDALNVYAIGRDDLTASDVEVAYRMTEDQILEAKAKGKTRRQIAMREDPMFRYSQDLYARECRMARVGVTALAGGVGILLGVAKFLSKDSDYTVPAMYLGLAAAAAIGEKRLRELPSGRELIEITFLGEKPFTSLQERYDISGNEWSKIARKMRDFDPREGELEDPKSNSAIISALGSGRELSDTQRTTLLRKLGGADPAVQAKLAPLVGGRDSAPDGTPLEGSDHSHFLRLLGFFRGNMGDESWGFVTGYIAKGASPKALRDALAASA